MKQLLLILMLATTAGVFAQENSQQSSVNVTGEGIVKVVPDQVVIRARVEHEGLKAEEVKKQNDQSVNQIIKFLKNEGIEEKNIETDYVNLNKRYNYEDKSSLYVANQAISIKLEDISEYEAIMQGLFKNGLNRIDGVQFKSSEMDKYEAEARQKAVLDAQKKAREFAEPLGQEIGKALNISESGGDNYQPVYRMAEMKMSDSPEGQQTIAPGEMEITVKVNVSFQLH